MLHCSYSITQKRNSSTILFNLSMQEIMRWRNIDPWKNDQKYWKFLSVNLEESKVSRSDNEWSLRPIAVLANYEFHYQRTKSKNSRCIWKQFSRNFFLWNKVIIFLLQNNQVSIHYNWFIFSSDMTKAYRSLDEIIDIFSISLSTAKTIIKKYKVDTFTNKGYKIHVKDFYKAYTKHYNPSLFDLGTKKCAKKPKDISDIFQQLFGSAYTITQ